MFGSQYAQYPDLLMKSLVGMNRRYRTPGTKSRVFQKLQVLYVKLFGIPEIGFQLRFLYFHKALAETKNVPFTRILDMGSGIGTYAFYLASRYPDAWVEGWDIDAQKISISKKLQRKFHVKNVSFLRRDITKKPENSTRFDFIITIDVLEHIKQYERVLTVMKDLIRPGGFIYIHTPQETQMRFFRQFASWSHEDHVRTGFDPKELRGALSKAGFTVIWERETFGNFGKMVWELHHLALSKSMILAGILYPFLYILARLDIKTHNKNGLGIAILAQRK